MGDFKKLRVWNDAMQLVELIYKLTIEKPFAKDFGLKDQIQRAAVSVASNIAEGDERMTNNEANRFFVIARGSSAEVRTQIDIAFRIGYISNSDFLKIEDLTRKISASLSKLILARTKLTVIA